MTLSSVSAIQTEEDARAAAAPPSVSTCESLRKRTMMSRADAKFTG